MRTVERLRQVHRQVEIRLTIFTALATVASVLLCVYYLDARWMAQHPLLVAPVLLWLIWSKLGGVLRIIFQKRVRVERATQEDLGGRTSDDVLALFREVRAQFAGRETPVLYLLPGIAATPNAMS